MIDSLLDQARRRDIEWDRTRHDRVRRSLQNELAARHRRSRARSAVRSGLLGMALLALAVRAFGGSAEASNGELYSSAPRLAHDDAGHSADVMTD